MSFDKNRKGWGSSSNMHRLAGLFCLFACTWIIADTQEETEIKFAFYSSAWGENTDDGLRFVAYNQTANPIRLHSIVFKNSINVADQVAINLDLLVPARGYAEVEIDYIDLLQGDECVDRTLSDNWRLVEISNYTLNPSVRNLIIENTDSFRIYQCVKTVTTRWTDLTSDEPMQTIEWVLYHFETRRD